MIPAIRPFLQRWGAVSGRYRHSSSFTIFRGTPADKGMVRTPVSVILFGFAGSPIHQLEKISNIYTELGYRTLYCILPMKFTFSYDMENILACAEEVVSTAKEEKMTEIVCHSLSNNGGVLYQHFTQMAVKDPALQIKGAVFDSSPGPLGIQNIQKYITVPGINQFRPSRQTRLFFPFHHFGVNMANRVPLAQTITEMVDQLRFLKTNWKKVKDVPWIGAYMTQYEREEWPLLFIYSKNDKLLPWQYVEEVIRVQSGTGRTVLSKLFEKSGPAGHVAHLKYHPIEYRESVKQLLEAL